MTGRSDDYVCKVCGSNNVIVKGWINLNTRILHKHDVKYGKTLCEECNAENQGIALRWIFEQATGLKNA